MAGRNAYSGRRVGMLMASLALGLASPAVHALCDACVVAAIREHKFEMMSQFKQLKAGLTQNDLNGRQAFKKSSESIT